MPGDEISLDEESRRILGKGTQRLADHAQRIESEIAKIISPFDGEVSIGRPTKYDFAILELGEQTKQLAMCIRAIAEFFS